MKIAKVLMVVLAVSLCCTAVNAQDDCSSAVSISCNSSGFLDPATDSTPTGPDPTACRDVLNVQDVWATFVADTVNARFSTCAGSVGTDSEYTVYAVDQSNICDSAGWTAVGVSCDECAPFNGDISIAGLTVGDTYLIQFGHWHDATSGGYDLQIDCPAVGGTCGDGIISEAGDEECDGALVDNCLTTCDPDCTCTFVPTPMLPKWGLMGLALMLVVGGVAVFGRGRMGAAQA